MRTAIDTNVVSALWSGEQTAGQVSMALDAAASLGSLVICPVVYAELRAYRGATASFVDEFLEDVRIDVEWALERAVWEVASGRFAQYAERRRRQGAGEAKRLMADFIIAAHASLRADRLMTLDQSRYRVDFPELRIVEA